MIKKISFTVFFVLILVFSAGAVQAGDVNVDDINSSNDTVFLSDDDLFEDADGESESGNVSLNEELKNQTILTSPTTGMYYAGNYKVTLMDSNTNATLANQTVYLSVNDTAYSAVTDSKGVASFNLKLNLGSYLATAYFIGDDSYKASDSLSCQVKVLTTIKASDVTKYYKASKTYTATYLDSQGKALKNKKVTITVNSKKYTKKTNSKGVASFAIDFKPGTYKVSTSNPSTKQALTTTFKILSTITASDLKKVKGDNNKFIAKFLKSNGKALAKKQVKVKINGKSFKFKTNSKGELKLPFNTFNKGTYKVVCYNVDGLSKTRTVQIYSIATTKLTTDYYTFLPDGNKEIKIKFSTSLDDSSKSGKVIRISIDGESYSQKTNSNGEINFKLPSLGPGLYTLECEYDGSKFFKNSYVYRLLTILDTSDTQLTVESDTSFGDYAGTPLSLALTAWDVPLIRKTVSFNIDGNEYNCTTDNYGIASLPINLDVGNYTVDYRSFDDLYVRGTSGSCEIEVFKRIDTNITCNFANSYKDSSQSFKVRLTDFNGTPIADEYVELILGDEVFYEYTDANGDATFKTGVAFGKYDAVVRFAGNNDLNSSSVSKSISVTISKYGNGINEKKASASSSYLKATKNCQVTNSKIKSMVKSLTKGLTNDIDKAKAIFNYVRDNIVYSYYYDSKKGAVKTLTSKSGNCADQAHLLVAMYRAAGFKARYVHGVCKFYDDGEYYGHIWTQVLIGGTWICGDSISYSNELGKINNWNTKNVKIRSKYLSLPF